MTIIGLWLKHFLLICCLSLTSNVFLKCILNEDVPMPDGIAERLAFLIGGSNAMDAVLCQPLLTASQAHAMGLINRVAKIGTGAPLPLILVTFDRN